MRKIFKIIKRIAMNRATILGYGLFFLGFFVIIKSATTVILVYSIAITLFGIFIILDTENGKSTNFIFELAKYHIQEHGHLNEKFVKIFVCNYCDRQGVYLAAKELGCLADFKKAIKGKQVIIPNF